MGRDAGRDRQKTDLGGGVEAEAEEDAERVQLPARADAPRQRAEEAEEQPAIVEPALERVVVGLFVATWLFSLTLWKTRRIEQRWSSLLERS